MDVVVAARSVMAVAFDSPVRAKPGAVSARTQPTVAAAIPEAKEPPYLNLRRA